MDRAFCTEWVRLSRSRSSCLCRGLCCLFGCFQKYAEEMVYVVNGSLSTGDLQQVNERSAPQYLRISTDIVLFRQDSSEEAPDWVAP